MPVRFAQTGLTKMTVGGIYKPNPLLGSYVTGAGFSLSHFDTPLPTGVLLSVTTVSVPVATLIGFLVLAAVLGLAAATWPARRAANLDVLAAIATE